MKYKIKTVTKYLCATLMMISLCMITCVSPVFADDGYTSTTETGQLVEKLWDDKIYPAIQDIGGTLAIATFVCSAFYFWIIGKDARSLEKAKGLMIGSGVGIVIIYIAPKIIKIIIDAVSSGV